MQFLRRAASASLACALVGPALAAQGAAPARDPASQAADEESEQATELPEMFVTGRRAQDGVPVVPIDSVGSRNVFGPEQVRETGARDLNDLVQNMPGVSTRPYNGGEASAPSFSMRGLPDDGLTEYIHVLIDGVPASPLPYGWTAFSFFPLTPERVHAVDYIRGAHSVRYSPDTVGGVLNFITQPIPSEGAFEMRSTFGDFDYSSSLVSAGATVGDFGYLLSYVDRRGDGYREDGGFDQQDFNLKLRQDLHDGDWLAVSLSYMEDEHKAPGGLTLAEFEANRFANLRPHNRFAGYRGVADLVWHEQLDSDAWLEVFSYASKTHRNLVAQRQHFPMGGPITISDWEDDSFVAAAGLRAGYEVGAHELYGGLRYQREWIPSWTIDSRPAGGGPTDLLNDDEYTIESYSVHIDDTIHPTEELTVTAGLRYEWIPTAEGRNTVGANTYYFDESYGVLLPGIGASYLLRENWSVFANYFEGLRAPQVWGFGLTPNPASADIKFEKAKTWELGTRVETPGGLSAALTAWRNEYDAFLVFYSGFYENLGAADAQGLDLEAEWSVGEVLEDLDGLSFVASITLQDAELASGPNDGKDVPYAWNQKAAWRVRYEFGQRWTTSLGGSYVGDSYSDELNTSVDSADGTLGRNPSRTLWDLQVAKGFAVGEAGTFDIMAGATNLFDEDGWVHSRGGFFGGGKVAGPPRQAYVGVGLKLSF
jgi:Fe(3+) dicitrate transport protein